MANLPEVQGGGALEWEEAKHLGPSAKISTIETR